LGKEKVMSVNLSINDLPRETVALMAFAIETRHSLFDPEKLVLDASKATSLSTEQARLVLYDLYKKVFDEFLEKIKEGN
jgi:hypothetical protein